MKLFNFRSKGRKNSPKGCTVSDEANKILRALGYTDDIADNPAYQKAYREIIRSHSQWFETISLQGRTNSTLGQVSKWDEYCLKRGQPRVLQCQRIGDAYGRYLSDFITDGPLSDSTVEDFLV